MAVYDVSTATVYLPDGERLEAHSGIGPLRDDPRYAHVKLRGSTPPGTYNLQLRERRFHGVEAIRLLPSNGVDPLGRDGLLAHTYMLRVPGDSNGCIVFADYDRFLAAFKSGAVTQMVVVPRLPEGPVEVASAGGDMHMGSGAKGLRAQLASSIPLPPIRPAPATDQDSRQQVAALDPVPVPVPAPPAADARSSAGPAVESGRPAFVDLSGTGRGFARRGLTPPVRGALGFAELTPIASPVRPAPPILVATPIEKQNFASLSAPVPAARNEQQAQLVKPDLGQTASLISHPLEVVTIRFGVGAYQDLRADRFTGAAVKPLHIASFAPMPDIFRAAR